MQQNVNNSERETWADLLRAFAIIAVILLHVSAVIVYRFNSISSAEWFFANLINSFTRFCVPVFLMLSGFFLLPIQETYSQHLIKLLKRIILPFLFWACIYLFSLFITNSNKAPAIYTILKSGISYHFWYVYLITAIYLVLPLIRRTLMVIPNFIINLLLALWPLTFLFQMEKIKILFPLSSVIYYMGYIGYLILGYRISKTPHNRIPKWLPWVLFISGATATTIFTYWLSKQSNALDTLYYQYLSPTVLLSAVGLFLAIRNSAGLHPVLQIISKSSYGIYLSHVLVLNLLLTFNVQKLPIWLYFPITFNACLLGSLLMVNLVQKLPFGKYYSGIST